MPLLDIFRQLRPLRHDDETKLEAIGKHLTDAERAAVTAAYRQGKLTVHFPTFGVTVITDEAIPQLHALSGDARLQEFAAQLNAQVRQKVQHKLFHRIADNPLKLAALLAPSLSLPAVKEAVLLQLFSPERLHILLVGDTGAEERILRDTAALAPHSSFTLLSRGKTLRDFSMLQAADKGLCCLAHVEHLKKTEQTVLAASMEKGEVHLKGKPAFDSRIRVLASAAPKGGLALAQVPLPHPLLSTFHLVFLLKKGKEELPSPGQLPAADFSLFKEFLQHAASLYVLFPSALEHEVLEFVERIKKKSLLSHSHIISAVISMAKALARMHLADKVGKNELKKAMEIMEQSLAVQAVSAASQSR